MLIDIVAGSHFFIGRRLIQFIQSNWLIGLLVFALAFWLSSRSYLRMIDLQEHKLKKITLFGLDNFSSLFFSRSFS
jgi:hypothetical protein